jgi:hypothetical protein
LIGVEDLRYFVLGKRFFERLFVSMAVDPHDFRFFRHAVVS